MQDKIAIMGVGAVGSYLGAFIAHTGADVTLIDQWPAQVASINVSGLKVEGSQGPFTARALALHLHEVQGSISLFDLVIIAVKSYDTLWAATLMEPYLKADGRMVSAQNGFNDASIASIVGYRRTIGCVMSQIGVAIWEPGVVTRHGEPGRNRGHDVFRIGELSGPPSPRADRLAQLLSHIDGARTTTNLLGERWAKLSTNCMGNPVNAMSSLGSHGQADMEEARLLKILIAAEAVRVGRALNYHIESVGGLDASAWLHANETSCFKELDHRLATKGQTDWHSSMGQDVLKGRRTEIDHLNGLISRKGREVGVPTPVNDATVAMVRQIDAGLISPSPQNVVHVLRQSEPATDKPHSHSPG